MAKNESCSAPLHEPTTVTFPPSLPPVVVPDELLLLEHADTRRSAPTATTAIPALRLAWFMIPRSPLLPVVCDLTLLSEHQVVNPCKAIASIPQQSDTRHLNILNQHVLVVTDQASE